MDQQCSSVGKPFWDTGWGLIEGVWCWKAWNTQSLQVTSQMMCSRASAWSIFPHASFRYVKGPYIPTSKIIPGLLWTHPGWLGENLVWPLPLQFDSDGQLHSGLRGWGWLEWKCCAREKDQSLLWEVVHLTTWGQTEKKLKALTFNKCSMEKNDNTNLSTNITRNVLCSNQSCCFIYRISIILLYSYYIMTALLNHWCIFEKI